MLVLYADSFCISIGMEALSGWGLAWQSGASQEAGFARGPRAPICRVEALTASQWPPKRARHLLRTMQSGVLYIA